MSNNIFRIFNPRAPKEDPVVKRRGQLRRAQQTYRDKKDGYIRSLETELSQTRTSEANLMRETRRLEDIVQRLMGLLIQHSIDIPNDLWDEGDHVQSLAEQQDFGMFSQMDSGHLEASLGDDVLVTSRPPIETSLGLPLPLSPSAGLAPEIPSSKVASEPTPTGSSPTRGDARLSDLDPVTVGMEFVLAVEEPCLGHLHGDPEKPDQPNGHALTTTAHLFSACHSRPDPSPHDSAQPPLQPPDFQQAPRALLDRLLALAPDLSTYGELTPIQAWHDIQRRPQLGSLDVQSLRALAGKLRQAVKCHGFGAVITRGAFESLISEILGPGRVV